MVGRPRAQAKLSSAAGSTKLPPRVFSGEKFLPMSGIGIHDQEKGFVSAERKQGWAACLPRCEQGHDSLHGHPSDGEYLNPSSAMDSFWGSNLQHGSHLCEYYRTTEVD